jgi:hypothetical protein
VKHFGVLISFLIFILGAGESHALNLTSDGLYEATREACTKISEQSLHDGAMFDQLQTGYFPSPAFNEVINYIRSQSFRKSLSEFNLQSRLKPTDYVAQSPGFQQALQECYPQSKLMREYFENAIYKSDRAGKIVGAATMVLFFRGSSLVLAGQKWMAVVAKIATWFQLGAVASVIQGDTAENESVTVFSEIHLNQAEEVLNKNTAEIKLSLQAEISALNRSLEKCGNCGEQSKLRAQKSIFEKALAAL